MAEVTKISDIVVEIKAKNDLLKSGLKDAEQQVAKSASKMEKASGLSLGGIKRGLGAAAFGLSALRGSPFLVEAAVEAWRGNLGKASDALANVITSLPIVGGIIKDFAESVIAVKERLDGTAQYRENAERAIANNRAGFARRLSIENLRGEAETLLARKQGVSDEQLAIIRRSRRDRLIDREQAISRSDPEIANYKRLISKLQYEVDLRGIRGRNKQPTIDSFNTPTGVFETTTQTSIITSMQRSYIEQQKATRALQSIDRKVGQGALQ